MRPILLLSACLFTLAACEPAVPGKSSPAPAQPKAPAVPVTPAPPAVPVAPAAPVASAAAPAPPISLERVRHWDAPPPMAIDPAKSYTAILTLQKGGRIVIALDPKEAPLATNNFVFLCRKGFYDGLTFHRVIEGFMAQGGDPQGTGMGGPGYQFKNERVSRKFDRPGLLAMANAGPDTNGSQFFITLGKAPWLDGGFTLFGEVTEGMEHVQHLTLRDPEAGGPPGDAIATAVIEEK